MRFWKRLARTLGGDRRAAEIRDELEFHLDMDVAEGRDYREARRRLGNPERLEDETRAVRIIPWLSSILCDVRDALRLVKSAPILALAVVASLGLGIGANTAIFSLIDAAILEPLPVDDPDSLVLIEWVSDDFPPGVTALEGRARQSSDGGLAAPMIAEGFYRRLAEASTGFDALIGVTEPERMTLAFDDRPAEVSMVQYVSGNFFRDLGVVPALGRSFADDEDRAGREPVVVVSHRFWTSRLGQSPEVVGRTLRVDGVPARIIGITPRGFFGLQPGLWTDVYAPLAAREFFDSQRFATTTATRDDTFWWVSLIGRLSSIVPEAAAIERLESVLVGLASEIAPGAEPESLLRLVTSPTSHGLSGSLEDNEVDALWVMQLLVGVLLLIVCANVANLLLSRSVSVQHESALRLALGASRARLFQRSLIESATLALLGGVIGLIVGTFCAHVIHALFQTGREVGSRFDVGIDLRVLAWAAALTLSTTLLFGIVPALRASRTGVGDVLKTRTRSVVRGGLRLPRMLVSTQIALCLAALMAAGLFARSLENFAGVDLGVDASNLSYATVNPWSAGYTVERTGLYIDDVRDALEALPGVDSVGLINRRVLDGSANIAVAGLPGQAANRGTDFFDMTNAVHVVGVGPAAFETLGITLLRGRTLSERDSGNVVIDERFVGQFFGGGSALGRRITLGNTVEYNVLGVARNVPWGRLREADLPVVYAAGAVDDQMTFGGARVLNFAIRSSVNPADLAAPVRSAIASIDPAVALAEFQTQKTLIDRLLRVERLLAFVAGSFGLWALVLAGIGLAGLLTYAAARRTGEIGVRMALGASPSRVVQMMLRDSFSMVAIGIVIGVPCAYGIGKVLESQLFGLEPTDIRSMASAVLALSIVALGATWLPARRAARIDPMNALREQ